MNGVIARCLHEGVEPGDLYELLGRPRFDPDVAELNAALRAVNREILPYQNHADPQVVQRATRLLWELGRIEALLQEPDQLRAAHQEIVDQLRRDFEQVNETDRKTWTDAQIGHWLLANCCVHPARVAAVAALLLSESTNVSALDAGSVATDKARPLMRTPATFRSKAFPRDVPSDEQASREVVAGRATAALAAPLLAGNTDASVVETVVSATSAAEVTQDLPLSGAVSRPIRPAAESDRQPVAESNAGRLNLAPTVVVTLAVASTIVVTALGGIGIWLAGDYASRRSAADGGTDTSIVQPPIPSVPAPSPIDDPRLVVWQAELIGIYSDAERARLVLEFQAVVENSASPPPWVDPRGQQSRYFEAEIERPGIGADLSDYVPRRELRPISEPGRQRDNADVVIVEGELAFGALGPRYLPHAPFVKLRRLQRLNEATSSVTADAPRSPATLRTRPNDPELSRFLRLGAPQQNIELKGRMLSTSEPEADKLSFFFAPIPVHPAYPVVRVVLRPNVLQLTESPDRLTRIRGTFQGEWAQVSVPTKWDLLNPPAGSFPPGAIPGAMPPGAFPPGAFPPGDMPAGGFPAGAFPPGMPPGVVPPGLPPGMKPPLFDWARAAPNCDPVIPVLREAEVVLEADQGVPDRPEPATPLEVAPVEMVFRGWLHRVVRTHDEVIVAIASHQQLGPDQAPGTIGPFAKSDLNFTHTLPTPAALAPGVREQRLVMLQAVARGDEFVEQLRDYCCMEDVRLGIAPQPDEVILHGHVSSPSARPKYPLLAGEALTLTSIERVGEPGSRITEQGPRAPDSYRPLALAEKWLEVLHDRPQRGSRNKLRLFVLPDLQAASGAAVACTASAAAARQPAAFLEKLYRAGDDTWERLKVHRGESIETTIEFTARLAKYTPEDPPDAWPFARWLPVWLVVDADFGEVEPQADEPDATARPGRPPRRAQPNDTQRLQAVLAAIEAGDLDLARELIDELLSTTTDRHIAAEARKLKGQLTQADADVAGDLAEAMRHLAGKERDWFVLEVHPWNDEPLVDVIQGKQEAAERLLEMREDGTVTLPTGQKKPPVNWRGKGYATEEAADAQAAQKVKSKKRRRKG
jgi:hypothetical protein